MLNVNTDELKHQLQDSSSSYVYTISELAPLVKEAAGLAGGIKVRNLWFIGGSDYMFDDS